jgi:hypothetical protein
MFTSNDSKSWEWRQTLKANNIDFQKFHHLQIWNTETEMRERRVSVLSTQKTSLFIQQETVIWFFSPCLFTLSIFTVKWKCHPPVFSDTFAAAAYTTFTTAPVTHSPLMYSNSKSQSLSIFCFTDFYEF